MRIQERACSQIHITLLVLTAKRLLTGAIKILKVDCSVHYMEDSARMKAFFVSLHGERMPLGLEKFT